MPIQSLIMILRKAMKYLISKDELYPVYYLGESANGFTIPKELVERYNKVMQEFAAVQEILRYIREPKVHDLPK